MIGIWWNRSPTVELNNGEHAFGIRSSFAPIQVGEGAEVEVSEGEPPDAVRWWTFNRRRRERGSR